MIRLLIDGYNLLHALGMQPRRASPRGLEKARRRMVRELRSRLSADELRHTVIIFDASRPVPSEETDSGGDEGPAVHFSSNYPDADEMIIDLIAKHSAPRKLTVVSSDHRIQQAAARRRARVCDSEPWFDSLEEQHETSADAPLARPVTGDHLGTDDIQEWLDEFRVE